VPRDRAARADELRTKVGDERAELRDQGARPRHCKIAKANVPGKRNHSTERFPRMAMNAALRSTAIVRMNSA
jgi:hypothetical protein